MSWSAGAILVALAGIAALLLATLLLVNHRHRRLESRAARVRATLGPMLAAWAGGDPAAGELEWLAGLSRSDGRTAVVLAVEALPGLGPEGAVRVREALRRSGLTAREHGRLAARTAPDRAEACRFAGRLGAAEIVPALVERLRDRDPLVRREAIRALGDLGAVEAVDAIVETIDALGEWDNLLLVMALVRLGPGIAPRVGALLADGGSPLRTKALLQVVGRHGVAADPGLVRTLAAHADPEVRVEAVRALGALPPGPETAAVCLSAMDDPAWPVRALAARSLGRIGDARAIDRLARAMGDPAYWVRHNVADAIGALGEPGATALRAALEDPNPFVRDMAAQMLFMRALADGEAA